MSDYTISPSDIGTYAHQLAANTIDTVIIRRAVDHIEVWSDGSAATYFTVDGSTPTIASQNSYELPAGGPIVRDQVDIPTAGQAIIQLISAGTPRYSITAPGSRLGT